MEEPSYLICVTRKAKLGARAWTEPLYSILGHRYLNQHPKQSPSSRLKFSKADVASNPQLCLSTEGSTPMIICSGTLRYNVEGHLGKKKGKEVGEALFSLWYNIYHCEMDYNIYTF